MTNRFKHLLCLLFLFCLAGTLPAQDAFRKGAVVSLGPGLNTGGFFQGYGGYGRKTPKPALCFALDGRLGKAFSLGFMLATSSAKLVVDPAYRRITQPGSGSGAERLQVDARRTVLGLRALFHYLNREKTEFYSGFRVGVSFVRRSTHSGYYEYDLPPTTVLPGYHATIKPKTNPFSAQLILFGARHYPLEFLGFGGELGLGAPYYLGLQVCFRLPSTENLPTDYNQNR